METRTHSRSTRSQSVSNSSLRTEPLRNNSDHGYKNHTRPKANADTLSEHELPKLRTQTGHHVSQDNEDRPNNLAVIEISFVEQWAGNHAASKHHGGMRRADPCDTGRSFVPEEVDLIERLEFAIAVDNASIQT